MKKLFIYVFMSLCLLIPNFVFATNYGYDGTCNVTNAGFEGAIVAPNKKSIDGVLLLRRNTGTWVFCLNYGKSGPDYYNAGKGKCLACSEELNNYTEEQLIKIAYIINKFNKSQTDDNYVKAAKAIWKVLGQFTDDNDWYDDASEEYDRYKYPKFSLSDLKLKLNSAVNKYEGSVTISNSNLNSYSCSLNVNGFSTGSCNIDGNIVSVSVNASDLSLASNTISLSVTGTKSYKKATAFGCGYDDVQNIAELGTDSTPAIKTKRKTATIDLTGNLQINKADTNGVGITTIDNNGPYFNLYKTKTNCENNTSAEYENLKTGLKEGIISGTYYLREIKAKTGYYTPNKKGDSGYCEKVVISAGQTTPINLTNKKSCETSFNENMTMKERIDLYWEIKRDWGYDYRSLLNMNNKTPSEACKTVDSRKYETTCLGATALSAFNDENISNYNEQYDYTFCSTTFTLENKYGTSNFGTIKSGRPIIRTDNVVATGILNRVCYNYGDAITTITPISYSNYITQEPILGGQLLIEGDEIDNDELLNQTITKDYALPKMYSHNKDGKVYYNSCPYGNQCKDLGYGIISKFNEDPEEKKLNFTIKLNEDIFGELNTSTSCNYTIENELIDNKNNVNLEFRSVKTGITNSFFSKTGSGTRKIGANWSNEEIRKQVLELNNNSYNKNNAPAKYVITLTPSIIDDIRSYNKSNKYDNYDFLCNLDGTKCSSNYLNELKLKYDIKNDLTDGWKIDSTKRTCILNPTTSGC